MRTTSLLLIFCFFISWGTLAQVRDQEKLIDSLRKEIQSDREDSNKVHVLIQLSLIYRDSDPKEGLKYGQLATQLAEKITWEPGIAAGYNTLGVNYKSLSDYPNALDNYLKSLKINEALNNKVNIARNTANIGNVYRELKNYKMALEYFNRSLKANEDLNRKFGITNNLSDMAIVHSEMKNNGLALEYLNRALAISEEINDREGVAIILGNIGNVYSSTRSYDKGIEFFNRSLALNDSLGRKIGVAVNYTNLANIYYEVATDTTGKAWDSKIIPADKNANLDRAILNHTKAIVIFSELSAQEDLSAAYKSLSETYFKKKDYKNAMEAYTRYTSLKDSIYSNDNKVKLANLTAQRAELEKQQQIKLTAVSQKKRREETILFAVAIALLSVFTAFVIKERRKSDKLLLNILPEKVAKELKEKGSAAAKQFDGVSVIFTDFVGFSSAAELMTPQYLVNELHTCFKAFDEIISKYGIEKIKTIGDAYMAASGLPVPDPQHAIKTVKAAMEIATYIARRRHQLGNAAFDIRIGVHSGNVVAGIVGVKKFAYDIWGDTVNIAARLEEASEPGKINISQATYHLLEGRFSCNYRGEIEAKNKGKMAMYFVDKEI